MLHLSRLARQCTGWVRRLPSEPLYRSRTFAALDSAACAGCIANLPLGVATGAWPSTSVRLTRQRRLALRAGGRR